MIRPLSVLFLLFCVQVVPSIQKPSTSTEGQLKKEAHLKQINQKENVKDERLEDEIESIGQVIHSEVVVVVQDQGDWRIKDTVEMKKEEVTNFTGTTLTMTEKTKSGVDTSIDAVEKRLGGDDGEKLRQPSENELTELSEKFKEEPRKEMETLEEEKKDSKEFTEMKQFIQEPPKTFMTVGPTEGGFKREEVTSSPKSENVHEKVKKEELIETGKQKPTDVTHPGRMEDPEEEEVVEEENYQKEKAKEEGINGSIMIDEPIMRMKEEQDSDQESEEDEEEEENNRISWDLIQLILLVAPGEKQEVTWWTMVLEAVKCSLRNCPYNGSYWHRVPVHLPRITRHRRQTEEFDPNEKTINTSKSTCSCKNLEKYFEKLYEAIGTKKEENEKNVTQS